MAAICVLDGNFEADAGGQSAPSASRTGANGGLIAHMASFLVIKAHVFGGFPLDADRRVGQAGTGGARSRAIRPRICPNIRPDTATSAIWNVT